MTGNCPGSEHPQLPRHLSCTLFHVALSAQLPEHHWGWKSNSIPVELAYGFQSFFVLFWFFFSSHLKNGTTAFPYLSVYKQDKHPNTVAVMPT